MDRPVPSPFLTISVDSLFVLRVARCDTPLRRQRRTCSFVSLSRKVSHRYSRHSIISSHKTSALLGYGFNWQFNFDKGARSLVRSFGDMCEMNVPRDRKERARERERERERESLGPPHGPERQFELAKEHHSLLEEMVSLAGKSSAYLSFISSRQ